MFNEKVSVLISRTILLSVPVAIFACLGTGTAAAELVYRPLHPAFGGDPGYFNHLFNLAQVQNRFTTPSSSGGGGAAAPEINFPPITIDLGGVGDTTTGENGSTGGQTANPAATTLRNNTPLENQ